MSEAAENLEGLAGSESNEPEVNNDTPTGSTAEDKARADGWRPLEEWEGDQSEWRSAEVFNERGVWINKHKEQQERLNSIETKFNSRMDNANKLHEAQLKMQKEDLVSKRNDAIDNADREEADKIQNQIDDLSQQAIPEASDNQRNVLDNWNRTNAWIFQGSPKAAYAQAQFGAYQNAGHDSQAAISMMESDVAREFPAVNAHRDNQPIPEGGSKPGAKRAARKLSMADLTQKEASIWRNMPGTWDSEADFLKAVQDTRGDS